MSKIKDLRTGYGYDVHALVKDRPLILGGVEIDHAKGLSGHSDADVLLHALIDALLGAAGLGDIGSHFPDTAAEYKNADSRQLLREVKQMLDQHDCMINNVDSTIVAEAPKLQPYIKQMVQHIADDLELDTDRVSVKATTSEGMGFIGTEEGMVAMAVATITKQ